MRYAIGVAVCAAIGFGSSFAAANSLSAVAQGPAIPTGSFDVATLFNNAATDFEQLGFKAVTGSFEDPSAYSFSDVSWKIQRENYSAAPNVSLFSVGGNVVNGTSGITMTLHFAGVSTDKPTFDLYVIHNDQITDSGRFQWDGSSQYTYLGNAAAASASQFAPVPVPAASLGGVALLSALFAGQWVRRRLTA